ncbi:MAG: penicillin-binding protein 1C [Rhizobiales bacterium]|nr:penicillin-binding protein 1C [Hyphomicrobiales bacterium]
MTAARHPLIVAGIALGAMLLTGTVWIAALGPLPRAEDLEFSTIVVDRDGRLLRPYATRDGRWRLPVDMSDVDPRFVRMLVAYEDKRFYAHDGIDPLAFLRAAWLLATNGRIVSGASTLTMQVARLIEPRSERSVLVKLRQMVRAVQLERHYSKDEILTLYLSLAPYGGNLEGIRAASLSYFGKEPRRLTLAQAALLVALPQSPEARRPDRAPEAARQARDRVLERIAHSAVIPGDEIALARNEKVPVMRRPMPMLAPHAADAAVAAVPGRKLHRMTIDAPLQKRLEDLARERAQILGHDISVAILAVEHATGNVRARVASADYFDARRAGQIDMTAALRSPGSALKPFIYGLAFEDGLVHPETLIEDRPVRFGAYAPENFDLTFQGTVTVRHALQMSLNVPAVMLLDNIGPSRLLGRLAQIGGTLVLPKDEAPGLAIALGGVGAKLGDLTMLYAGIARGGTALPLTERADDAGTPPQPARLFDPAAAWYVANALIGTPPPDNASSGRIAFKTGTSYGYRDAWALGFDGKRTIGVWAGRPDGAPMPGLIGRTAAAPILFDAFARIGQSPAPLSRAPKGVLLAVNTKLPVTLQRYRPGVLAGQASGQPPRILFPPDGARIELGSAAGRRDPVALKIVGGIAPLTVLANGVPIKDGDGRRSVLFEPEGPGFVRLTVTDANGAADSVMIRLQ